MLYLNKNVEYLDVEIICLFYFVVNKRKNDIYNILNIIYI